MFFRTKELKEKQALINVSRKNLANAEERLDKMSEELRIARHNNIILLDRNRKQEKLVKAIKELAEMNQYNNERTTVAKIKELISDFDSQN